MSSDNFIWIFGENLGSTANNNSFYFWRHVVNIKDKIDKYIVFEKNDSTKEVYNTLSSHEKKFVLWKNSRKHYKTYFDADMFFVTLSYKDITPDKLFIKTMEMQIKKPLIYLQHGTIGMKEVFYNGNDYWNNIFRFFIYTDDEFDYMTTRNKFRDYQLYNAKFHPRYGELLRKDERYQNKNQILWFITWREYFGRNAQTEMFINHVKNVVESEEFKKYLTDNKLILKICVHQFFDQNTFKDIYKFSKKGLIEIVNPSNIDVMDELNKSKLLITDYSSVAYDFSFLNRPVILFQPDIDVYIQERGFYCKLEDLEKFNIKSSKKLIDTIVHEKFSVNPFFKDALPQNIDYEAIKQDKHIDNIYNHFKAIQENKITFLLFNAYDYTNFMNYTFKLAEVLLKSGYLVDFISLIKKRNLFSFPPFGLSINSINIENDPSLRNKMHKRQHKSPKNLSYLQFDSKKELLHPYTGFYLTELMKTVKTKTLVSASESLHLFVDDVTSPHVENRIFLNNPYDVNDELLSKLKNISFRNDIFTSRKNQELYESKLNKKFPNSLILPRNILLTNQIAEEIDLNDELLDDDLNLIEVPIEVRREDRKLGARYILLENSIIQKKEKYRGISIVDFDECGDDDLKNIIDFAIYLRENNINNVSIDVYGTGFKADMFLDLIESNDLFSYIYYRGLNKYIVIEIREHDFLVDFAKNPVNNLNYLLGLLNYKKVFCFKNDESSEVFKDIPNSFFDSWKDLCLKIDNLSEISLKELKDYYALGLGRIPKDIYVDFPE